MVSKKVKNKHGLEVGVILLNVMQCCVFSWSKTDSRVMKKNKLADKSMFPFVCISWRWFDKSFDQEFFFSLCMSMILILIMIKSQLVKCHISPSLSDRMRWTVKCQQARASGHLISHRFSYNQMSGKTAPHTPLTYQPLCVSLTHSTMTVSFLSQCS